MPMDIICRLDYLLREFSVCFVGFSCVILVIGRLKLIMNLFFFLGESGLVSFILSLIVYCAVHICVGSACKISSK